MTPFTSILQADLIETKEGFEVHCDLPGCNPSDLGKIKYIAACPSIKNIAKIYHYYS